MSNGVMRESCLRFLLDSVFFCIFFYFSYKAKIYLLLLDNLAIVDQIIYDYEALSWQLLFKIYGLQLEGIFIKKT